MADPNFTIPCYYYQTCPPAIMPPPYAFHPFQPPDYSPPIPPYLYHQPQPPPHTPPTSYTPYTPYTPQPPSYYTPPTSYTSPYLSDSSGVPWYSTNQHEIQARPNPYHPPSNCFTSPFITTTQFPFGVIDEQQPELVVSQVFDESPHSPELIVNSSNDNCHQMYDKFTEIIQKLEEIGKNLADQSRKSKEMSSKKVSQSSHTLTHVPIVSNLDKSAVKSDFEEIDKLEARVVCEDVLESETKDEVSVEKENMSTCEAVSDIYEIDYGTVIAEEVGCVDEAKDEVETNATKLLPPLLHLAFQAFDKFISKLGRFPIATKLQKKLEDAQVFIVGSGASRDPSKKQAPMCTVHSSPHNIDHWLIWARSEFEGLLEKTPTEVDTILSDTSEYTSAIVNAGIFERKDKDAMFSFVEATSKQQDRVRTLFDTGWNTSHQKHIHNDKFEGVVTTYRQVGELFNPPAALKSVFSAAKIERLGNWFNDGSDPRWCCTCLLDATDPLFIEIGKAFIRKIFDPGGQALEVTRRWRDDFWSVMSVAYLICLGAVFGVLRLNRFRKKNKLNMDRYISKILENHEGLTEDYWPLYVVAGAVATVLGWVVVVTWFTSKPDDEVFGSYFDYILEDKNVLKRRHM